MNPIIEFTPLAALYIIAIFLAGILIGRLVSRSNNSRRTSYKFSQNTKFHKRSHVPEHSHDGMVEIYVGNLPYDVNEKELEEIFSKYGKVSSSRIIRHKFSNKSKGFGFVEMSNYSEAKSAIESLNGTEIKGRRLAVNEARSSAR